MCRTCGQRGTLRRPVAMPRVTPALPMRLTRLLFGATCCWSACSLAVHRRPLKPSCSVANTYRVTSMSSAADGRRLMGPRREWLQHGAAGSAAVAASALFPTPASAASAGAILVTGANSGIGKVGCRRHLFPFSNRCARVRVFVRISCFAAKSTFLITPTRKTEKEDALRRERERKRDRRRRKQT